MQRLVLKADRACHNSAEPFDRRLNKKKRQGSLPAAFSGLELR
jgi:hypothetical protein